ncbi:MAG TPA: hypothetical protein VK186_17850 [Candidatus Deferrimicrobium sp.]|nr:hypothetical protein [Candidatus Kapabacteria bacterium]HLP60712.1 hypothetical protein [Candidatus Deferrimicrobium sp.]
MKKDIFIDNNIAKNFCNPMDPEYKKLIAWLMKNNPTDSSGNAYLVVSNKLLAEYNRSVSFSTSASSIPIIIDRLTREGRLIKVNNTAIKEFQRRCFSKKIQKNLRSNLEDQDHIPVVLLSDRKYALSLDEDFIYDLTHFPGFRARVEKRPEKLPYEE